MVLNTEVKDYNAVHKDCMAVVWAVLVLLPYLNGHKLTIRTYRNGLECMFHFKDATRNLARWRLRLSGLESDVLQRAGIKKLAAHTLSQLKTDGTDTTYLDVDIPDLMVLLVY